MIARLHLFLTFVNEFPNRIWNLLFGNYNESKDHSIDQPEFWWRELFHLLGGQIIGLLSIPILSWIFHSRIIASLIATACVGIVIGLKEFVGDASEQDGGWDFKNVVDTIFWILGTAIIGVFFCLLQML
jgi:hypothetical protein